MAKKNEGKRKEKKRKTVEYIVDNHTKQNTKKANKDNTKPFQTKLIISRDNAGNIMSEQHEVVVEYFQSFISTNLGNMNRTLPHTTKPEILCPTYKEVTVVMV